MKVACKIWLDHHGKAFGEGPYEFLKLVEKTNSLHKASHRMGMAYSKACKLIQTMGKRLGCSLPNKRNGFQSAIKCFDAFKDALLVKKKRRPSINIMVRRNSSSEKELLF